MIFADTGALFAYATPDDEHHQEAQQWLYQNKVPLVTTDYVIDETLTLMRARSQAKRAILFGEMLFSGEVAEVYHLTETLCRVKHIKYLLVQPNGREAPYVEVFVRVSKRRSHLL
jgi:predicted nucleic acid-binding protein